LASDRSAEYYYCFALFIPTTAQQFHARIYTITQQASYMFWPFSAIIRKVFDKEKEKHNIG